jgi:hypothetical protein
VARASPARIVTIAASAWAKREDTKAVAGAAPKSAVFRDSKRQRLIELAGARYLSVPAGRPDLPVRRGERGVEPAGAGILAHGV